MPPEDIEDFDDGRGSTYTTPSEEEVVEVLNELSSIQNEGIVGVIPLGESIDQNLMDEQAHQIISTILNAPQVLWDEQVASSAPTGSLDYREAVDTSADRITLGIPNEPEIGDEVYKRAKIFNAISDYHLPHGYCVQLNNVYTSEGWKTCVRITTGITSHKVENSSIDVNHLLRGPINLTAEQAVELAQELLALANKLKPGIALATIQVTNNVEDNNHKRKITIKDA